MTQEGMEQRTHNEIYARSVAMNQYLLELKAVRLKWDPLVSAIIPHGIQTAEQDTVVNFIFKCENEARFLCRERFSRNRLAAQQIELDRYAAEVGPGCECTHNREDMLEYLDQCKNLDQFTSKAGHYERMLAIGSCDDGYSGLGVLPCTVCKRYSDDEAEVSSYDYEDHRVDLICDHDICPGCLAFEPGENYDTCAENGCV